MIHKEGNKYTLRSKKSHKALGKFATKRDALKRERQVQFFKRKNEAA